MKNNSELYSLVYDFYKTRILYGFYRCGDRLPPVPHMCETFHVGRITVRTALSILEEEGYIRTEERRSAKVVFSSDFEQCEERAAGYFVSRKEGLLEFNAAARLLFIPLWEAGAGKCSKEQWITFQYRLSNALPGDVPPSLELYLMVLSALDNRLILNLYWEGMRYIGIPFLMDRKKVRNPITEQTIQKGMESGDVAAYVGEAFKDIYLQLEDELFTFIKRGCAKYHLETAGQIPFHWNIYRRRPQMRYTLSSILIREIMHGKYPVGSYLPTLSEMVRQYRASQSTVRRTLALLGELGITESCQGKGTRVCMKRIQIDLTKPEVREGLRLFRESLQFLTLTGRSVLLYTLKHASQKKSEELTEHLHWVLEHRQSYCCFEIMLMFIRHECPLAMVRECYERLANLVAWGYPFIRLLSSENELDWSYYGWVKRMEQHLLHGNPEAFIKEWVQLLGQEERKCRTLEGLEILTGPECAGLLL